jgi:hypothetical protein
LTRSGAALRRLVHTPHAHRDRMWGVVARIAAAAVVVAAVQHHVSQIYEAWRSEQQEGHQETKLFPKRPDDVAGTDGEGSEGGGGRDETRTRADRADAARATGSERGASGPSGGHRTYSTVAVGASSAPRVPRFFSDERVSGRVRGAWFGRARAFSPARRFRGRARRRSGAPRGAASREVETSAEMRA